MTRRTQRPPRSSLFGREPADPPRPDRPTDTTGSPPASGKAAPVGLADVPKRLADIAERLPRTIRLGTSSWSFPGWANIVYDRSVSEAVLARHGLAAYARHPLLRTTGVDRTYYAPVSADVLAEYAAVVPDDFRFVVKAPSLVTDPFLRGERGKPTDRNEQFLDVAWTNDHAVGPYVEGLGEKGGCLLFQFPPLGRELADAPGHFAEDLQRFLEGLPRGPAYRIELRDKTLLVPIYTSVLESTGVGHCVSVHPRAGELADQAGLPLGPDGPLVIRWMLHSGFAYEQARSRYAPFNRIVDEDAASRAAITDLALGHALSGRDVLVVTNNKAEGSAPLSVFQLAEQIATRARSR